MKYLVTGGAGFIGSHLVDRLLEFGAEVLVIDDLSEGKIENLPVKNPNLKFHNMSIMGDIGELFKGVDTAFHLAALTRPQVSILHPKESTSINVGGTLRILEQCVKSKVKRLVFISSSSLYGDQEKLPESEDAAPNCMSPYALTKLVGEQYCKLYEKLYNLESNYIRPFNVYGTRQNPSGGYAAAVPKFIDSLNNGHKPFITGDGEQSRDFTYVDDVVDLIIRASQSKVHGEAFNAGAGNNVSVNKLFDTIAELMNTDIKPDHVDAVIEPKVTLADISKAKKLLGWEPKVKLKEGLKKTIEGTIK